MIKLTRIEFFLKEEIENKINKINEGYTLAVEESKLLGNPMPQAPNFVVEDDHLDMIESDLYICPEDIRQITTIKDGDTEIVTPNGNHLVLESPEEVFNLRQAALKVVGVLVVLLSVFSSAAQLPYSWTTNVNPGWTSSNASINTLSWQAAFGAVSTSDINVTGGYSYLYNNSQVTAYTSPVYDFTSCSSSSFVQVSINLFVFLENRYDWLYFQYSTNAGASWVNPVAQSSANNLSGVNLSAYAPLTNWAGNASNRNGWTGNLGTISPLYLIPKTANRFRFIFASDVSGNSIFGTVYSADILDFTVTCPVVLPTEIVSFEGSFSGNSNTISWESESETNNNFYTLERYDAISDSWNTVVKVNSKGMGKYFYVDTKYETGITNYYRLQQTDLDGTTREAAPAISVDNTQENVEVTKIVNSLGQDIDNNTKGIVIIHYSNGTTHKTYRP